MKRLPLRLLVLTALVGGGVQLLALPSEAAPPNHKTFSESVTYAGTTSNISVTIPAGADDLVFSITNRSSGPQAVPFGSFQLQVPVGITISSADLALGSPSNFNKPVVDTTTTPATVTVTSNGPTGSGIAPGDSISIDVSVSAASGVCPGTWATEVKQSNDFSGTGNDFDGNSVSTPVAGGTHLVWTVQPGDTEYDKDMSPAPQVTIEDGCGSPVSSYSGTVTLTDTAHVLNGPKDTQGNPALSFTASSGVATFTGVQFTDWGLDDQLVATTDTGLSATSASFTIFQFRTVCSTNVNQSCSSPTLSGPQGETLASVTATGASTPDVLTLDVKDQNAGTCNGTTSEPPLGEMVSVNVTNRAKTVTMTLPKTYVNLQPNNGTPFMDICLDATSSNEPFFDQQHYQDPVAFPNQVLIGLVPDCSSTGNVAPCIVSRKKNAGNEIITFTLPPGDPHTSWY